jgi:DNA-binding HxlR family transcriptional regulator
MDIWNTVPKRVLRYLLSSTADARYFNEIVKGSSSHASEVSRVLGEFVDAGIVLRQEEGAPPESEFRGPRVYYPLTPAMGQGAISILQWDTTKSIGDLFPRSTSRYPSAGS